MKIEIGLSDDGRSSLDRLASRLGDRDSLYAFLLRVLGREAVKTAGKISASFTGRKKLRIRSGDLARSITGASGIVDGLPAFRVGVFTGPSVAYAAIQEQGTKPKNPASPFNTIRPRNAKLLAQPVNSALTPAGVSRFESPRDYPGELKFIRFKNKPGRRVVGGLYPLSELKKATVGGRVNLRLAKAAYLLRTKTDLEPGFFLRDGVRAALPEVVSSIEDSLSNYVV